MEAVNKLKGTAKTWYDSFVSSERDWSTFTWRDWKSILSQTFRANRDAYKLFMGVANHRPTENYSLHEFHFEHLSRINKLRSYSNYRRRPTKTQVIRS
jgi:hypothetical protein